MPSKPFPWMDTLNLLLTIGGCLIGVVVAFRISRSADDLSQSSLFVSSASFLLEKEPASQCTGVDIVNWLRKEKHLPPPEWMIPLVQQVLNSAAAPATTDAATATQGTATACAGPPVSAAASSTPDTALSASAQSSTVASALLNAVGGLTPRLFIQFAEEGQRSGAQLLRHELGSIQLNGQTVLAPRVQLVTETPNTLQLRFLKKADAAEAAQLASDLRPFLGSSVSVVDRSATYQSDANVKPRTYELWIPRNFSFPPSASPKTQAISAD